MKNQMMLIVNDVELNRKLLKGCFEHEFCICMAENGRHAWEILMAQKIDIVITDILMPIMSGFELIAEIRKNPLIKDTLIVAITDRGEAYELKALKAGADDFINKPFLYELLRHRVNGVLVRNFYNSSISRYQRSFNQFAVPFAIAKINVREAPIKLIYQYPKNVWNRVH